MFSSQSKVRRSLHVTLVMSALVIGGCSSLGPTGTNSLAGAVQSAAGSNGNVNAHQRADGSVMLIGRVDGMLAEQRVINAAASFPGVTEVIDRISVDFR